MAKLVLLPSTSLQFIGSFYRHPARLQIGALRQPACESVRIRIDTTVPDPSLRIIILLIFTLYFYIRFRLPTCPSSSDWPTGLDPLEPNRCRLLSTDTQQNTVQTGIISSLLMNIQYKFTSYNLIHTMNGLKVLISTSLKFSTNSAYFKIFFFFTSFESEAVIMRSWNKMLNKIMHYIFQGRNL